MTAVNLNRAIRGPVTAVPVVAGKGVRIVPDVENNRFVVEADETVLYNGDTGQITSATNASLDLSEAAENFEYLLVYVSGSAMSGGVSVVKFKPNGDNTSYYPLTVSYTNDGTTIFTDSCVVKISGESFTVKTGMRVGVNSSGTVQAATNRGPIIKGIVGINRIANT